jgi:hypothetical protein
MPIYQKLWKVFFVAKCFFLKIILFIVKINKIIVIYYVNNITRQYYGEKRF